MKPETVKFTKEVELADAVGKPIKLGSVLKHIEDGERGVVVRIVRAGDMGNVWDAVGDIHILTHPGSTRVTNYYKKWLHIPRKEQSYRERLQSWLVSPFYYEEGYTQASRDEARAMEGIMAILPEDPVDYNYGPSVDRVEDALHYLVEHLENLK